MMPISATSTSQRDSLNTTHMNRWCDTLTTMVTGARSGGGGTATISVHFSTGGILEAVVFNLSVAPNF